MDKQDELVAAIRSHFATDIAAQEVAAAVRSFMGSALGFGTEHDASLNLQGVLDDLRGQQDPNDGGVCAATVERVIEQIEALRPLSASIGEDIGGGHG